jgi:hypothetical protein
LKVGWLSVILACELLIDGLNALRSSGVAKSKSIRRASSLPVLVPEQVERTILVVRGRRVLLDEQLAGLYGVPTKALIQAVKRNARRFPEDFMFRIAADEWEALRSQIVTSKGAGRGGRRYAPYAFTEQGVAMLSSVLRSSRAIEVNIEIMRAFVRLRQLLTLHKELGERLAKLERQMQQRDHSVDQQFQQIFTLLEELFSPPEKPRKRIGFHE